VKNTIETAGAGCIARTLPDLPSRIDEVKVTSNAPNEPHPLYVVARHCNLPRTASTHIPRGARHLRGAPPVEHVIASRSR